MRDISKIIRTAHFKTGFSQLESASKINRDKLTIYLYELGTLKNG